MLPFSARSPHCVSQSLLQKALPCMLSVANCCPVLRQGLSHWHGVLSTSACSWYTLRGRRVQNKDGVWLGLPEPATKRQEPPSSGLSERCRFKQRCHVHPLRTNHVWTSKVRLRAQGSGWHDAQASLLKLTSFCMLLPAGSFLTRIFHPNIAKTGEICVNTLKRDWKPTLGLRHVLLVGGRRGHDPCCCCNTLF